MYDCFLFHYIREDGIIYLCLADAEFGKLHATGCVVLRCVALEDLRKVWVVLCWAVPATPPAVQPPVGAPSYSSSAASRRATVLKSLQSRTSQY